VATTPPNLDYRPLPDDVLEVDPTALSKTNASQFLKGSQSYYYWHQDQERRRANGEKPVPIPLPKKLASSEVVKEKGIKTISNFAFLDDSSMVKVYINLEGDLAGVSMSQVESEFSERTLMVTIETAETIHRFWVDRLAYDVDPLRCKVIINKSGKLVLKLHKKDHTKHWQKLRALT